MCASCHCTDKCRQLVVPGTPLNERPQVLNGIQVARHPKRADQDAHDVGVAGLQSDDPGHLIDEVYVDCKVLSGPILCSAGKQLGEQIWQVTRSLLVYTFSTR